ncbi:MAG TPA: ATP-binding protein [Methylomirabilota bacterium]|nr:ATP-binding protein [Methylomirabilota bacterium]
MSDERHHPVDVTTAWLAGGGEMGERIRAFDWGSTPLGPTTSWPQSLRSAISILLPSKAQICMFWGPELVKLYNDAYIPVLGRKHPAVLGLPGRQVWPEIWDVLGPLLHGVVETGEAFRAYDHPFYLIRHGFEEETYFDVSYDPIRDETGRVGGVFCIVSETTGRVLSGRRLRTLRDLARASESRSPAEACRLALASLAASQQDIPFMSLYLLDDDGTVARAQGTIGAAPGGALSPVVVALDDDAWPFAAVARSGRPLVHERLAPEAAREIPSNAAADRTLILPIMRSGQCAGFIVAGTSRFQALEETYRDFFDLVAAQISTAVAQAASYEEERERAEALAELDRAKTTFFSNISHEFRTPLTLMLGPLDDLLGRGPAALSASDHDTLAVIGRNGRRLLKLVNTLLDFSRIQAGRNEALYEPTDLGAFTANLAGVFRSAIEQAGLKLEVRCPAGLEPVYVDHGMWEKIVLNLLSNAFKFTFEGGISIELADQGSSVMLMVRDTGIGIAPADVARVFDRFHRVENARARTHEGSGIGLALVQELVRLHGGEVRLDSAPGRGSTFTVTIPRGQAHLPPDRIASESTSSTESVGGRSFVEDALGWLPNTEQTVDVLAARAEPMVTTGPHRSRIVLADDNADMRQYVTRLLREHWDVEAVGDGRAALAALRARPADLVLTDVMMPGLDGFGLLRALRDDPALRDTPVILLSARAGEESRVEGLAAGADDYVIKPFSARELVARVESHLKMKDMREHADADRRALLAREQAARREAEEKTEIVETVNRIGQRLVAQTDLTSLVQSFTDEATRLAGAQFGAFFYNVIDEKGESYTLYTIAGVPRSEFEKFPLPRNTAVFAPTFRGERIIRLDDVRLDPRYGQNAPHHGMPKGHLPVTSYLAVPVVSRTGTVIGGLFLGHEKPAMFGERLEPLMAGLAAQLAIAIDNARLLDEEQRARTAAEAASRAKDEFLAVLSHELRTPLNAVYGWAHLLRSGGLEGDAAARALDVIMRNANAQVQLIDDMLDVSRIVTGKMRLDVRSVDLKAVVEAAIDVVRPAADAKDLRLQTILDSQALGITGDPGRLQQVVWNLLINAVKFTPRGGRIQVHLQRTDSHAEISVSDTGQGIAADVLPHVFERFQQGDSSSTRQHTGLGLGLALVRHLVELHGGSVEASSPGLGLGATFTVRLPIAIARAVERDAKPARERAHPTVGAAPPATALRGVRVLVVDDDRDGLELVAAMLMTSGADVRACSSVVEGLKAMQTWEPDVLISDIEMPGEDGYSFIRRVRGLEGPLARTPAVALTAYGRGEDRLRTLAAGYSMHVPKPVDPVELAVIVANLAGRA